MLCSGLYPSDDKSQCSPVYAAGARLYSAWAAVASDHVDRHSSLLDVYRRIRHFLRTDHVVLLFFHREYAGKDMGNIPLQCLYFRGHALYAHSGICLLFYILCTGGRSDHAGKLFHYLLCSDVHVPRICRDIPRSEGLPVLYYSDQGQVAGCPLLCAYGL